MRALEQRAEARAAKAERDAFRAPAMVNSGLQQEIAAMVEAVEALRGAPELPDVPLAPAQMDARARALDAADRHAHLVAMRSAPSWRQGIDQLSTCMRALQQRSDARAAKARSNALQEPAMDYSDLQREIAAMVSMVNALHVAAEAAEASSSQEDGVAPTAWDRQATEHGQLHYVCNAPQHNEQHAAYQIQRAAPPAHEYTSPGRPAAQASAPAYSTPAYSVHAPSPAAVRPPPLSPYANMPPPQ